MTTGPFCNKLKKSLRESYARCNKSVCAADNLLTSILESLSTSCECGVLAATLVRRTGVIGKS